MRFSSLVLFFSVLSFASLVFQTSSAAQDANTSEASCPQDEYELNSRLRDARQNLRYVEADLGNLDGYIGIHHEAGQIVNGINRLEAELRKLDTRFIARRDETLGKLAEIRLKIDNANSAFREGLARVHGPSRIRRMPSIFLDGASLAVELYGLLGEIDNLESEHNIVSRELYETRDEVRAELEEFRNAQDNLTQRVNTMEADKKGYQEAISILENCLEVVAITADNNPYFQEVLEPQQYAGRYFSRQNDLLPIRTASGEELNLFLNSTFLVKPYPEYDLTGPIEVNLQQGSAVIENENTRLVFSAPAADLAEEQGQSCLRTTDINQDGTPDIFGTLVMLDGGRYFPHYLAVLLSSGSEENVYRSVTIGFDDIAANSLDHISDSRGILFNTIIQCITINSGGNGVNFNIDVVPHHIVTYAVDEYRTRQQRIFYELR